MLLNWIKKNAYKLTDVEGANFHILTPKYESLLLDRFGTTEVEFEDKVLKNRVLMVAFCYLWDRRNFETNLIEVRGNKVNDKTVLEVIKHENFKITLLTGFISKKHLDIFMNYALSGYPQDDIATRLQSLNRRGSRLFIPFEEARDELFDLRDDQLEDIFFQQREPPYIDMKRLIAVYPDGEKIGIVWMSKNLHYLHKFPQQYSEAAFNTKVKTPPRPNAIYVEGPITLTEWTSKKRGIHIYMFGDHHTIEMKCKGDIKTSRTLSQIMLESIEANKNKTIDIFLEYKFLKQGIFRYIMGDSYISRVSSSFIECLGISKAHCEYKNARFHYSDIRNLGIVEIGLYIIQHFYTEVGRHVTDTKTCDAMLKQFLADERTTNLSLAIKEVKVSKQLDAIEDKNLVTLISEHFEGKLKTMRSGLETLIHIAEKTTNDRTKGVIYATILERVLLWISSWMDYYTVARMFRSYKTARQGYSSDKARYVMIYFGDVHCDQISAFLRTLPDFVIGERSESNTKGEDFQCLKVSAKLPLFKYG